MTCQELADFICDYVEGRLPEDQHEVFEEHLSVCPSCIAYIKSYEATCRMVKDCGGGAEDQDVPEKVPEALIQAILKARGE